MCKCDFGLLVKYSRVFSKARNSAPGVLWDQAGHRWVEFGLKVHNEQQPWRGYEKQNRSVPKINSLRETG